MKKIFALFLVLLFIFSLAACTVNVNGSGEKKDDKTEDVSGSKSDKKDKDTDKAEETKTETEKESEASGGKEDETKPAEGEQPAQSKPAPASTRQVIVHTSKAYSDYYAEDGKLIFSFFSFEPRVSILGGSSADKINSVLQEFSDSLLSSDSETDGLDGIEEMREAAEQFYEEAGEYFYTNFALERRVYIPRIDENVLSLLFNDYYYIGGAHGGTTNTGLSFDVESGELLTLDSVFSGDYMDFFRQRVIDTCESEYAAAVFPSYQDYIGDFLKDGCWYFDDDGIIFVADEYVIAPYASGPLEFAIPYADLADYIDSRYLPVQSSADGSGKEPKLGELGTRDTIDFVGVVFGGETFCFLPQDTVTDVRLYATAYYAGEENISVFNDYVIWACSSMTKKQALEIENMFPDVVPNIGISCTLSDGSDFSRLIYQSGEDGSILFGEYR